MSHPPSSFYRALSEELDPEKLQRRFLMALLDLQNVERGSIWVRKDDGYMCVEAVGSQSEKIKGLVISARHPSIVGWVIEHGEMTIAEPGKDERHYKEIEEHLLIKSKLILCFPLLLRNREVYGAVEIIDTSAGGSRLNLNRDYLELLQDLVDIGSLALSNSLIYTRQVRENQKLKRTLDAIRSEELIIGKSLAFLKVMKASADYARTDFPVLITGESGTGKELVAREIHRLSNRCDKPFFVQNCSAIPDTLLESELFGYTKGAFTGALRDKVGLFEAADGGTVFLDEIGDMPHQLQARILRVIQNSEVKPLGGTITKKVDVRIISATNKDLKEAISRGSFREDLYYRLNVLPIHIPPLRERREDIPLLLDHFIKRESLRMGATPKRIAEDASVFLIDYPWKGNVRELENFVKHIIVVADGSMISYRDLAVHFSAGPPVAGADFPPKPAPQPSQKLPEPGPPGNREDGALLLSATASDEASKHPFDGCTWEGVEKAYVLYLLEKNKWHITRAAKEAGVNRSTFDSRMKKLGIKK